MTPFCPFSVLEITVSAFNFRIEMNTYVADDGKGLNFLRPVIVDEDGLVLHLDAVDCMSLLERVLDDLFDHRLMKRVGDVEHVVPVALPSLGVLVGEVLCHVVKRHQLLVEVLHRQLVILHHGDELDLLQLEQLLVAAQHFLGEVPGEHLVGGHIVLRRVSEK